MQLPEPVLHLAALTVGGIPRGGCVLKIGHDEKRIVAGILSGQLNDFRLDAHAPPLCPASGGVRGLSIDVLGAFTVLGRA